MKMDFDKLYREEFAREHRWLAERLAEWGLPYEPLPESGHRPEGYYTYYVQNGIRSYPNRRR